MLLRRRFPHSGLSRHLVFLTSSSAVGRSVLLRVGKEVVIAEESKFFSELVVVPFGFNTLVRGEGCLTGAGWLLSSPGGCRQYVRRMTRPPFAVLDIGSTVGDDGGGPVGVGMRTVYVALAHRRKRLCTWLWAVQLHDSTQVGVGLECAVNKICGQR
jgi:hypothetical protein